VYVSQCRMGTNLFKVGCSENLYQRYPKDGINNIAMVIPTRGESARQCESAIHKMLANRKTSSAEVFDLRCREIELLSGIAKLKRGDLVEALKITCSFRNCENKCCKCGHVWKRRVLLPKACPACKSHDWTSIVAAGAARRAKL